MSTKRPTQPTTKLDRLSYDESFVTRNGRSQVETPLNFARSHPPGSPGTRLGPVSRLEALLETRSPSARLYNNNNNLKKSEIRTKSDLNQCFSQSSDLNAKSRYCEIGLKSSLKEKKESLNEKRSSVVTSRRRSVNESESDVDNDDNVENLKSKEEILFSTKSVPNLVEIVDKKTYDRHITALRNIESTNLSVSLPFDLNEVSAPKPCPVTEYDDYFTLDQTVLERSERRSLSKSNALRYRSSIRIMVRPEASAALSADPESSVEFSTNKTPPGVPHRSIVKEQFR